MVVTDIHQSSQSQHHLYPGMELKLGVFGLFLIIKMTVVRQILLSLDLLWAEREGKTRVKCHMTHKDCARIGFAFCFCVRGRQNPEDPILSPMADDVITQGDIGGLGSLVYICEDSKTQYDIYRKCLIQKQRLAVLLAYIHHVHPKQ